ncbi:MAG: hypothetical protein LBD67_09940 [Candidatus Accumulibacter sp.]|nr:hypothetical protein [Accumulibacter sp.]
MQGVAKADRYRRIVVAIENRDAQSMMDALMGKIENRKERVENFNKGQLVNLSDLFGSVTSNKVAGWNKSGAGHSDSYYRRGRFMRGLETFADLFDIHGGNDLFWRDIVERLMPETSRAFWELLK